VRGLKPKCGGKVLLHASLPAVLGKRTDKEGRGNVGIRGESKENVDVES
jgi:hypothetical protein